MRSPDGELTEIDKRQQQPKRRTENTESARGNRRKVDNEKPQERTEENPQPAVRVEMEERRQREPQRTKRKGGNEEPKQKSEEC